MIQLPCGYSRTLAFGTQPPCCDRATQPCGGTKYRCCKQQPNLDPSCWSAVSINCHADERMSLQAMPALMPVLLLSLANASCSREGRFLPRSVRSVGLEHNRLLLQTIESWGGYFTAMYIESFLSLLFTVVFTILGFSPSVWILASLCHFQENVCWDFNFNCIEFMDLHGEIWIFNRVTFLTYVVFLYLSMIFIIFSPQVMYILIASFFSNKVSWISLMKFSNWLVLCYLFLFWTSIKKSC